MYYLCSFVGWNSTLALQAKIKASAELHFFSETWRGDMQVVGRVQVCGCRTEALFPSCVNLGSFSPPRSRPHPLGFCLLHLHGQQWPFILPVSPAPTVTSVTDHPGSSPYFKVCRLHLQSPFWQVAAHTWCSTRGQRVKGPNFRLPQHCRLPEDGWGGFGVLLQSLVRWHGLKIRGFIGSLHYWN